MIMIPLKKSGVFSAVVGSILAGSILCAGCATQQAKGLTTLQAYLNQNEFTGLEHLGTQLPELRLNYSLNSPSGEELPLPSCVAVNNTVEGDVATSHYHLWQLLKVNCTAAEYYFTALGRKTALRFLPDTLSVHFINRLPASAVPNVGGEFLAHPHGVLADAHQDFKVISADNGVVEVALSLDTQVNYRLIARGDFDADGVEDMLLRLDWYTHNAFGKGFDLVMVSQTGKNTEPLVIWRYNPAIEHNKAIKHNK